METRQQIVADLNRQVEEPRSLQAKQVEEQQQLAGSLVKDLRSEHDGRFASFDERFNRLESMISKYFSRGSALTHDQEPRSTHSTDISYSTGTSMSAGVLPIPAPRPPDPPDFPKFDGTQFREWVNRCEQFFYVDRTPPEMMARLASSHMEGKALQWHRDFIRDHYGIFPSWPEYFIAVSARFCEPEPLYESMVLKQSLDSVETYMGKFKYGDDSVLEDTTLSGASFHRVPATPSQDTNVTQQKELIHNTAPALNRSELISAITDAISVEDDAVNLGFDTDEEPVVAGEHLLEASDHLSTQVLDNFDDDVAVSVEDNNELSDCDESFPVSLMFSPDSSFETDSSIQEIELGGEKEMIVTYTIQDEGSRQEKEPRPYQVLHQIEAPSYPHKSTCINCSEENLLSSGTFMSAAKSKEDYAQVKRLIDLTLMNSEQRQLELSTGVKFQTVYDDEAERHTLMGRRVTKCIMRTMHESRSLRQLVITDMRSHRKHKWSLCVYTKGMEAELQICLLAHQSSRKQTHHCLELGEFSWIKEKGKLSDFVLAKRYFDSIVVSESIVLMVNYERKNIETTHTLLGMGFNGVTGEFSFLVEAGEAVILRRHELVFPQDLKPPLQQHAMFFQVQNQEKQRKYPKTWKFKYKRNRMIKLMQLLSNMWWSYDKVAELTQELQQLKIYLQGVKLKEQWLGKYYKYDDALKLMGRLNQMRLQIKQRWLRKVYTVGIVLNLVDAEFQEPSCFDIEEYFGLGIHLCEHKKRVRLSIYQYLDVKELCHGHVEGKGLVSYDDLGAFQDLLVFKWKQLVLVVPKIHHEELGAFVVIWFTMTLSLGVGFKTCRGVHILIYVMFHSPMPPEPSCCKEDEESPLKKIEAKQRNFSSLRTRMFSAGEYCDRKSLYHLD